MNKVLFVCVENAGRSQMAEAFFKKYAPESFQVSSAGTKPALQINPIVVHVMKEVNIEMSGIPKTLSSDDIAGYVKVINMGCMDKDECPTSLTDSMVNWNIPDPKYKSHDEIRTIRDQIEFKVKELVSQIKER